MKEIDPKVSFKKDKYENNKSMVLEWTESIPYGMNLHNEVLSLIHKDIEFYEIIYSFSEEKKKIGYFTINPKEFRVWSFYILKKYQLEVDPKDIFEQLIILEKEEFVVKSGCVSSQDSFFLNLLLDHQKEVKVLGHSPSICLRKQIEEISHPLKFKKFVTAKETDGNRIWELIKEEKYFLEEEEMWDMLRKQQFFLLFLEKDEKNEKIVGLGNRGKSDIFKDFWSIGMFVNPEFRKQRIGTFILKSLQNMCIQNGKIPIAGGARENIGSRKTQHKAGMVNKGSFLYIGL